MIITIDLIKQYNPCKGGIARFESQYPGYNDTLVNLLALDNVSYSDKIWLATKVVDVKTLQQWSVECAENVVDNFNNMYPNDTRVQDCINTTKKYLNGECSLSELLDAAESAARSAARSAAWSAARSAESAAESAAWSARSAAEAARAAAWWSAVGAEKEQEDINLSILIALLENK